MKTHNKTYLSAFVALGVLASGFAANASETPTINEAELKQHATQVLQSEPGARQVTTKVEIEPVPMEDKKSVRFMDFDMNGDGSLSQDEVGEMLFSIFDRDGNRVIDNVEMEKVGVLSFTPMVKKTVDMVSYDSNGTPEKVTVTEEEFMKRSQLIKFDKEEDGLTPLDFLGMPFNKVNVRDDGVIDMYEWQRAYAAIIKPLHEENFNYNG